MVSFVFVIPVIVAIPQPGVAFRKKEFSICDVLFQKGKSLQSTVAAEREPAEKFILTAGLRFAATMP